MQTSFLGQVLENAACVISARWSTRLEDTIQDIFSTDGAPIGMERAAAYSAGVISLLVTLICTKTFIYILIKVSISCLNILTELGLQLLRTEQIGTLPCHELVV